MADRYSLDLTATYADGICSFCGQRPATGAWMGVSVSTRRSESVSGVLCVCEQCAVETLPRLMIDAVVDRAATSPCGADVVQQARKMFRDIRSAVWEAAAVLASIGRPTNEDIANHRSVRETAFVDIQHRKAARANLRADRSKQSARDRS